MEIRQLKYFLKLAETLKYLGALQDADLTGVIVTPAPDERKAIPAPAEEAEAAPAEEEPAAEEPAAEEPAEEPAPNATGKPDYFKEFEEAVYKTQNELDEALPAEDGDSPLFQF